LGGGAKKTGKKETAPIVGQMTLFREYPK